MSNFDNRISVVHSDFTNYRQTINIHRSRAVDVVTIVSNDCGIPLQWCHNGHDIVSNHQPHDCLLNRIFRRRSKKISKLRVTGLCVGNSPETGEFPAQMASNAENVSMWWRYHILRADKGRVTPGQLLASCGRLNNTRNGAHKSGISCVTLNNSLSPERTNSGSEISLGTILSTALSVWLRVIRRSWCCFPRSLSRRNCAGDFRL